MRRLFWELLWGGRAIRSLTAREDLSRGRVCWGRIEEVTGGPSGVFEEGFVEGAEARVADAHGNFCDITPAVAEEAGGALDAQFPEGGRDGRSGFRCEEAAEVEGAAADNFGEHLEAGWVLHVAFKEGQDALAAFVVRTMELLAGRFTCRLLRKDKPGKNFVDFALVPQRAGAGCSGWIEGLGTDNLERGRDGHDTRKGSPFPRAESAHLRQGIGKKGAQCAPEEGHPQLDGKEPMGLSPLAPGRQSAGGRGVDGAFSGFKALFRPSTPKDARPHKIQANLEALLVKARRPVQRLLNAKIMPLDAAGFPEKIPKNFSPDPVGRTPDATFRNGRARFARCRSLWRFFGH